MGRSQRLAARLSPTPIGETAPRSAQAFTLVELLFAVGLIVLLSAVSLPTLAGTIAGYRVRTAAWQVAGDLRMARAKAVSTRRDHRVCVSGCSAAVPANGYLIQRKDGPSSWAVDTVVQPPSGDVQVMANRAISFGGSGETNGGTVTLMSGSRSFRVITALSGRVRVCKEPCS